MQDHARDVEMANNLSPEGLVPVADSLPLEDDRKRICTDRSNSSLESVGSETLSPPTSNEDDDDENENYSVYCASISEIIDFKPTQLEVIEEGEFVWRLDDFLALGSSSEFVVGGTPWSLSYSLSDRGPGNKFIGLHLKAENCDQNDPNWAVCAEFILGICNPDVSPTSTTPASVTATLSNTSLSSILSSRLSSSSAGSSVLGKEPPAPLKHAFSQSSFHRFTADELDWGFHHMCPFSAYKNGIPEINVGPLASTDSKTAIVARVRVVKDSTGVLWHNFNNYDSKAVTGYVGLLNQGATCYMNSFVQSIFLTNHFRAAVYKIPTEDVSPTASIPLALQRIFYKLQTGSTPPSTIEMTKSFGWDSAESFMQHDVQEFSRVLMDDLENKMKGSEVEGTVERLFRGKLKNVLKCTQVDYESVREESFYDLQMTIKGVKDLKESFEKYVAAEMLCGDNQYRTDDFGLQDAKKFVTFEHFPPVLHVHLERYAFDMMAEATVKIHDRFEFPVDIELDPYLSENSPDRSESQNYWLHSVLVHAGDGHGGHYFVYIRHPSRPDCWYKFDDTRVIPCTQKEAVDENFGGSDSLSSEETLELFRSTGVKPYRYKKFTSAYLLVYIRKSELDSMLESVDDSSVPEYLVNRIKADDLQDARRRHERQQQHLYSDVTLLTDESIRTHSGPDLCDPEESENVYKCKRETLISDLCSDFLPNEHNTECYPLVPRRNKTVRPDFILSDTHLRTLSTAFPRNHIHPLAFYIRAVSEDMNEPNLWIRPLIPGNILVFFKWFDGEKLIGLGSMAIDNEATLSSVTPFIAQRLEQLDIPCNDAEFSLYEEFKPSKIVPLNEESTFKGVDLRHGDIIIFEERNAPIKTPEYFIDLISWRHIDLKPVSPLSGLHLENVKVSTKWNLKQLTAFLASKLSVHVDHLRVSFTSDSNCIVENAMDSDVSTTKTSSTHVNFLKTDNAGTVKDFLIGTSVVDTITVVYEILPENLTVSQAENQVRYVIECNTSGESDALLAALPRIVYLSPYVSSVTDLIREIRPQTEDPKKYRLLKVQTGRIRETLAAGSINESLTFIDPEKCNLYLESAEHLDENDKLISCYTFERSTVKPFGIPFKTVLKAGETVKSLKSRLSSRLANPIESLILMNGNRERKLEDLNEILTNLPGKFSDDDQLAVQMGDPRKHRSSSGFDGAIRFRK